MQQPEGMSGRRGVEDDVVELCCGMIVAQQLCEFVKGGDFDGAGARQLLLDAPDGRLGQNSAVRTDNAFAIFLRRFLWVDIHGRKPRNTFDWSRPHSRDECPALHRDLRQDRCSPTGRLSRVGQRNGGCTRNGGLTDTSFAREQQIAGQLSRQLHLSFVSMFPSPMPTRSGGRILNTGPGS